MLCVSVEKVTGLQTLQSSKETLQLHDYNIHENNFRQSSENWLSNVNVSCYKTLQFDSYTFSVLVHTVSGCQ